MGTAREPACIPWGAFLKLLSSLIWKSMSARFYQRRQLEKLLMRPSQEVAPDCKIGGLTKRAFGTIPNCSSPLSNLNRLLRVWLLIAQCDFARFGANLEPRAPLHSAILIYTNCQKVKVLRG